MLKSPVKTHRLHKFKHRNRLYIADIDFFCLVEVNLIAWEAVEFSSTLETDVLPESSYEQIYFQTHVN